MGIISGEKITTNFNRFITEFKIVMKNQIYLLSNKFIIVSVSGLDVNFQL